MLLIWHAAFGATVHFAPRVNSAVARLAALRRVPADDLAYLREHGPDVARALRAAPHEWQRWWWVAFAGQIVFLPFVFVLTGRWSPRRAKQDEAEHERLVQEELAALNR